MIITCKCAMEITYFETEIETNKFTVKKTWGMPRQAVGN